jgi:DNA repair protein RadD
MINPACQMKALTDKGYLSPLKEVNVPLSDKIKMHADAKRNVDGEYKTKDIETAVDPHIYDRTLKSIQYCDQLNVKKAMIVTATINHAEMINNYLLSKGQKSVIVHSKSNNRDKNVRAFKEGDARFIVSVSTLTTGFDVSALEMIINLRQIGAKTLYVQLMGRGTRKHTFPDGRRKECCWILDWTTSTSELGPVDEITGRLPRANSAATPVKACPAAGCDYVVPVQTRICPGCGHEFEFNVNFHELLNVASDAPVMSGDYDLHKSVDDWVVEKHISEKGAQSIKISFLYKGEVVFKEYLAWHALGENKKPKRLWKILRGGDILPESFNAAWLRRADLKRPDFIQLEVVLKRLQVADAIYQNDEITDKAILVETETDVFS